MGGLDLYIIRGIVSQCNCWHNKTKAQAEPETLYNDGTMTETVASQGVAGFGGQHQRCLGMARP